MASEDPLATSAFSEYRLTSMQSSVTELLETVASLEFRLRNLKEDAGKFEVNICSEVLDFHDDLDRVRASGNKVGEEVLALKAAVRALQSAHVRMRERVDFCLGDFRLAWPLHAANARVGEAPAAVLCCVNCMRSPSVL